MPLDFLRRRISSPPPMNRAMISTATAMLLTSVVYVAYQRGFLLRLTLQPVLAEHHAVRSVAYRSLPDLPDSPAVL